MDSYRLKRKSASGGHLAQSTAQDDHEPERPQQPLEPAKRRRLVPHLHLDTTESDITALPCAATPASDDQAGDSLVQSTTASVAQPQLDPVTAAHARVLRQAGRPSLLTKFNFDTAAAEFADRVTSSTSIAQSPTPDPPAADPMATRKSDGPAPQPAVIEGQTGAEEVVGMTAAEAGTALKLQNGRNHTAWTTEETIAALEVFRDHPKESYETKAKIHSKIFWANTGATRGWHAVRHYVQKHIDSKDIKDTAKLSAKITELRSKQQAQYKSTGHHG